MARGYDKVRPDDRYDVMDTMQRLVKFLHTMGAIGLMGAMACLLVMLSFAPPPQRLAEYALLRGAMGSIATWIFLPSMALTLVASLLAMATVNVVLGVWRPRFTKLKD